MYRIYATSTISRFGDQDADAACVDHGVNIDPGMGEHEEAGAIATGDAQELLYAAGMEA